MGEPGCCVADAQIIPVGGPHPDDTQEARYQCRGTIGSSRDGRSPGVPVNRRRQDTQIGEIEGCRVRTSRYRMRPQGRHRRPQTRRHRLVPGPRPRSGGALLHQGPAPSPGSPPPHRHDRPAVHRGRGSARRSPRSAPSSRTAARNPRRRLATARPGQPAVPTCRPPPVRSASRDTSHGCRCDSLRVLREMMAAQSDGTDLNQVVPATCLGSRSEDDLKEVARAITVTGRADVLGPRHRRDYPAPPGSIHLGRRALRLEPDAERGTSRSRRLRCATTPRAS